MEDPELQSDETVLAKAQRVFVKSIPFEGTLTDRQIILIDREKKLLPTKKIPLGNITETFCGEDKNASPTLTLSVTATTGVTRQLVLTFQRLVRVNPTRERDDWVKKIRRATAPLPEKGTRKTVPGLQPAPVKAGDPGTSGAVVANAPVQQTRMPPKKAVSLVTGSGRAPAPVQHPVTAPGTSGAGPKGAGMINAPVQQTRMPPKKTTSPAPGSGPVSAPVQPPAAAPKKAASPATESGTLRIPQPPASAPKRAGDSGSTGSSTATAPVQPPAAAPKKAASPATESGALRIPQPPASAPKKSPGSEPPASGSTDIRVRSTVASPVQPPASRVKDRIHPSRKIQVDVIAVPAPSPAPAKKSGRTPPDTLLSCPKCGHKVPVGSRFCDSCGSRISSSP
jgi:hypothetical protein